MKVDYNLWPYHDDNLCQIISHYSEQTMTLT